MSNPYLTFPFVDIADVFKKCNAYAELYSVQLWVILGGTWKSNDGELWFNPGRVRIMGSTISCQNPKRTEWDMIEVEPFTDTAFSLTAP